MPWIGEKLGILGKKTHDIIPKFPHAEMIWFAKHADALIAYLQAHNTFSALPALNDTFPIMQLAEMPRIEIVLSSSCCHEMCSYLFSALRLHLNDLGIHIPMILYADTSYNKVNNVGLPELPGSVYVVGADGIFIDTRLQCDTPSAQYQLALPYSFQIEKLSCKEQQDYSALTVIGGLAMLDLFKVGVTRGQRDQINPYTYIAPDALIIYYHDKLKANPRPNKKALQIVQKLMDFLDDIDLRIVVVGPLSIKMLKQSLPEDTSQLVKDRLIRNRLRFYADFERRLCEEDETTPSHLNACMVKRTIA